MAYSSNAFQLRASCAGAPRIIDDVRVDLAPELALAILTRSRVVESVGTLNRGGWKSSEGLFSWGEPAVAALMATLERDYLLGCRPVGWAMVNASGSHHPRHNHASAIVSGIYYVDPGDAETSPTVFEIDAIPREADTIAVAPAVGRLVLFPGAMWHSVPPYASAKPRITIAWDVRK